MARRLRDHLVSLELTPDDLQTRDGTSEPVRRPSSADVAWVLTDGGVNALDPRRATFADAWGHWHRGKATLQRDARGYVVDADADGPRVVRTPVLAAAGVRAWKRIEFCELAPAGAAIGYRLYDGASEYAWTGAAWVAQVDDDTGWTDPDVINEHLAAFPTTARQIAVVARLSSTDRTVAPAFYGVRIALSVADQGDEDDAVIRAVLATLRAEVTVPSDLELVTRAAITPAAGLPLFAETPVDVRAVDAVYDLTADPSQLTPIAGAITAWTPGTPGTPAAWTPTAATIAAGHRVRVEASVLPQIVVQLARDLGPEFLGRLPQVRIYPGSVTARHENDGIEPLRPRSAPEDGSAPIGLDVDGAIRELLELDVVIVAERGTDARRIASALGDWLGVSGYRRVVSRETGRISTIRAGSAFASNAASLAENVTEVRATWVLEHEVRRGRTFGPVGLVRPGGVTLST